MDIRELNVQENRVRLLESKGFSCVEDVQEFFPRTYYDFSEQQSLYPIFNNQWISVVGTVDEVSTQKTNNILMVKAKVIDEKTGRKLHVMWIGAYYIYNIIRTWEGARVIVCGKLTYNEEFHSYHMNNPMFFDKNVSKRLCIHPVYKKMSRISEEYMHDLISEALKKPVSDTLPEDLRRRHGLLSRKDAIRLLHNPSSIAAIEKAKERITYDKLLFFATELEKNERKVSKGTIYNIKSTANTMKYISSLPYELTPSQKAVFNDMKEKAVDGRRINALIQGDVGSGKTTSAFLIMFAMADSGYQSLIMAPTVILAKQHFENLEKAVAPFGYKVAFLGGKQTQKERKTILEGIKKGEYTFIVGTHSVISDSVEYKNLALAIIDEEHKFGVVQREKLADRAKLGMHQISMSATPIPRTIANVIFGNGLSVYDLQVPSQRKPVMTCIYESERGIFQFIEQKLNEGQQAYVVCPFIEDPDDEFNIDTVEDVFDAYSKRFNTFGDINVGVVTGKMKSEDADKVISDFAEGKLKILVSTTIIEVGVNVPKSNVIVIHNAERFGLAQLHQLRGRVGRGKDQGFCILKSKEKENERLTTLCKTTNGYELAEADMKLRGTGNILGTEQSGENEYINLIIDNQEMYKFVKEDAKYIVDNNIAM